MTAPATDYSAAPDDFGTSSIGTWQVAIDRLELDVARLELHLDHGRELRTDIWNVPTGQGPLPPVLRERAEVLLARQQVCLERVTVSLGRALRQRAVTEAVTRNTPRAQGLQVYVDIAV